MNIFISIPFRCLPHKTKRVVFYYQPHGNATPLIRALQAKSPEVELYLLAFPEYLHLYNGKHNLRILNMLNLFDMVKVARSDVVVTNYIPLTLVFYARFTNIKFVDVWHGLPMLKNQTPRIMNFLNYYTEAWVSSPAMKDFYAKRYQLRHPERLIPTGYARTDDLFNMNFDAPKLKKKFKLPAKKPIILIAPTWKHNNPERNAFPFGLSATKFLAQLQKMAEQVGAEVVWRSHMLGLERLSHKNFPNIKALPSHKYPNAEEILAVTDMVVTDWSSIAYDFLATGKPVIFLDTDVPFVGDEVATRSGPQNRFGPIVNSFDEFTLTVQKYLNNPSGYSEDYAKRQKEITNIAYGTNLDGHATDRCYYRLKKLLDSTTVHG